MACGVHLGILLICLVQAEHVCCSWATQAQNSGNRYVGFSQKDSGLRRLDGSYPQNQLRQASVSLGSARSTLFNPETASSSSSNQALPGRSYTQTVSQPAQSGYAPVRLVQSSSVSQPNWRTTNLKPVNAQAAPKKQISGLSTSIASGSSLSKYSQKQSTPISQGGTWPVQQGTPRTSQYLSSSSASAQSPSRERLALPSASYQKPPSAAAKTPAYDGRSSGVFSAGAPAPQQKAVRMQTSATAKARRVPAHRRSGAAKPGSFSSPQKAGTRNYPSQIAAATPYQSKLFPVAGGNAKGSQTSSNPAHVSYTQALQAPYKQNAAVHFEPRSSKTSTSQRLNYKPSYTSTEQIPSRNPAWGAGNLPASGSSGVGASSQRFAPTRTHNIPNRFGGYAIRRLKEPVDQREVGVSRPVKTYAALPQRAALHKPQAPSVHQESKWTRIRPGQAH